MQLKYRAIATKVSPADYIKFKQIARKFNVSSYELYQSLLLVLVRYIENVSGVSEEHEQIIKAFFSALSNSANSFNPLSINGASKRSIKSAILFIQQPKKAYPQPIFVSMNDQGEWEETYNLDIMLKTLLGSFDIQLLDALESEKELQGYFSLTNTLQETFVKKNDKIMHEEINRMFSDEVEEIFDSLSIETSLETKEDVYYKRKFYKSIDGVRNYTDKARTNRTSRQATPFNDR